MEVNTLDYAMREVLSMEYKDKRWQPIAFLSKSLNKTERNYEIHNKEMLVVIRGLENWRLLRLIPLRNSIEKGKGYDDMIGCAIGSLS